MQELRRSDHVYFCTVAGLMQCARTASGIIVYYFSSAAFILMPERSCAVLCALLALESMHQ